VLVNGATGTAGRLAVQLAKHLGAGAIIATGRNAQELEALKELGADVVIPFTLGRLHPSGAKDYENALKRVFTSRINVVIDYRGVRARRRSSWPSRRRWMTPRLSASFTLAGRAERRTSSCRERHFDHRPSC
jgi:threonine dehydrogenase-like Zn-dependent dehydrogenase